MGAKSAACSNHPIAGSLLLQQGLARPLRSRKDSLSIIMRAAGSIVLALAAFAGLSSAQDEPIGTVIGIDLGE